MVFDHRSILVNAVCLLCFRGCYAWAYCKTCNSDQEYCEFGCCGNGDTKHCCENTIAIGVGTAFGSLALILVLSGVFLMFMQKRYSRADKTKTMGVNSGTQIEDFSDLSKVIGEAEYVISRDHLSGKLLLTRLNRGQNLNRNMVKQPPPPGIVNAFGRNQNRQSVEKGRSGDNERQKQNDDIANDVTSGERRRQSKTQEVDSNRRQEDDGITTPTTRTRTLPPIGNYNRPLTDTLISVDNEIL